MLLILSSNQVYIKGQLGWQGKTVILNGEYHEKYNSKFSPFHFLGCWVLCCEHYLCVFRLLLYRLCC